MIYTRSAASDLLLHDVAMGRTVAASKLIGLGIDYWYDAQLNLGRMNALLILKLE